GSRAFSSRSFSPINTPSAEPTIVASTIPMRKLNMLVPTALAMSPSRNPVHTVDRISDNGGKYSEVLPAEATHHTTSRRRGSHTMSRPRRNNCSVSDILIPSASAFHRTPSQQAMFGRFGDLVDDVAQQPCGQQVGIDEWALDVLLCEGAFL